MEKKVEPPSLSVEQLNSLLHEHPSLNRFTAESEIGHGYYARTFRATEGTDPAQAGEYTVLKVIVRLDSSNDPNVARSAAAFQSEAESQKQFSSSTIVDIRSVEIHPDFKYPILQLEYCNKGDLWDYLGKNPAMRVSEDSFAKVFKQMLTAVYLLHTPATITVGTGEKPRQYAKPSYVHMDLKPENFLVHQAPDSNEISIKLGDFGFVEAVGKITGERGCTPTYAAPEVRNGDDDITTAADVWSLGVLLCRILTLTNPYAEPDPADLDADSWLPEVQFDPIWDTISPEARDLVSRMVILEVHKRISVEKALQHPWVNGAAPDEERIDFKKHLRRYAVARKVRRIARASSTSLMLMGLSTGKKKEGA
jgi:serine/threonine protein kinase